MLFKKKIVVTVTTCRDCVHFVDSMADCVLCRYEDSVNPRPLNNSEQVVGCPLIRK